jgi:hypothetical protein
VVFEAGSTETIHHKLPWRFANPRRMKMAVLACVISTTIAIFCAVLMPWRRGTTTNENQGVTDLFS